MSMRTLHGIVGLCLLLVCVHSVTEVEDLGETDHELEQAVSVESVDEVSVCDETCARFFGARCGRAASTRALRA